MKTNLLILILAVSCFTMSCNTSTKANSTETPMITVSDSLNAPSTELYIEDSYTKESKADYLSDKFVIAKNGRLKGYTSLNIKGHRYYDIDKAGHITAVHDISNNYGVYTYDQKNRLIKSENKQHHPAEVYYSIAYTYSEADSVMAITTTSYKANKPIKTETTDKDILLSKNDILRKHFKGKSTSDFYISPHKDKIVAYEDDMIFCCGVIMKGKNKLVYYLNKNELIDSLSITGISSGEHMTFEYVYER